MKKLPLLLASFFIGLSLFAYVIKFVGWENVKKSLLVFTGWQGLVILFLTLFWILVANWKWKEILKSEGIDIPFFSLFKPYLAGFSVLYLFPTFLLGGEFFRGYILKKKYSLSWSKGMASVFIDRILDWTANLIIVFLGTGFFLLKIGFLPKRLAWIFGITFLFWLIGISFFYFKVFKKESIARFFLRLFNYKYTNSEPLEIEKEIFNFFKSNRVQLWKGIGLAFLEEAIILLRISVLLSFFGIQISLLPVLSISGFSYLATMIPIPASLGIHDAIQTFAFNSLGLGTGTGAAFTLIIRGAELILALIGLFFFFRLGFKFTEENLFKNNS